MFTLLMNPANSIPAVADDVERRSAFSLYIKALFCQLAYENITLSDNFIWYSYETDGVMFTIQVRSGTGVFHLNFHQWNLGINMGNFSSANQISLICYSLHEIFCILS